MIPPPGEYLCAIEQLQVFVGFVVLTQVRNGPQFSRKRGIRRGASRVFSLTVMDVMMSGKAHLSGSPQRPGRRQLGTLLLCWENADGSGFAHEAEVLGVFTVRVNGDNGYLPKPRLGYLVCRDGNRTG
jgi:hypothetical protein